MTGSEFERWRFRMNMTQEEAAIALCISHQEVVLLEAMDCLPECYQRALRYLEDERPPAMGPLALQPRERTSYH